MAASVDTSMSPESAQSASSPVSPGPSFRPLYDQIKILLTQSLVAGEWKPGEAIPSEMELAARFRVSQGTVRKAIDALAAENILIRRQGKGTYVATHTEPNHQYRFLRITPNAGDMVYPTSMFLDVKRGKASAEISRGLELKAGAPVTSIHRVLLFSGKPVVLDEVVVPSAKFPLLSLEKLEGSGDGKKGSLYSFFETTYGFRMIRAEERIRAIAADAFTAKTLRVAKGTPLLCVDRIAFTYGDKPVEWRRGLCLTENYAYYNELA